MVDFLRRDRTVLRALVDATLIETAQWGVVTLVVGRDVTALQEAREEAARARDHLEEEVARRTRELQEAKAALRRSEGLFQEFLGQVFQGWVIHADRRIVDFSEGALNLVGAGSREEIIGKSVLDFVHPDFRDEVRQRMKRLLEEGGVSDLYEEAILAPDGRELHVLVTGFPVTYEGRPAIQAVLRDVTEERLSQRRLAESEARFRTIFEMCPEPISLSDLETGELIDVNQRVCEIVGKDREELLGRTTVELGFYTEADRARLTEALSELGELHGWEMTFKGRGGEQLTASVYARVIEFGGRPLILTLFVDLTERRRMEARMRRKHKMEAMGTLAGGVAHQFNNILGVILGNAELGRDELAPEHPTQANLKEIVHACLRAREAVERILNASRKVQGEKRPLELHRLIRYILPLIRASLPPRIEIQEKIEAEGGVVRADGAQLREVLINLASNASDATGREGGILEIGLDRIHLHEERPGGLPPGDYMRLWVRDTGCGIPPENLERIFDPYFTTKGLAEATGMGLSVARSIVEGHGGQIRVRSKPGEGARFDILLPAFEGPVEAETSAPDPQTQRPTGTERVLLVEGEGMFLDLDLRRLESLGYRARGFLDPVSALQTFRKDPMAWDLVVTDMTMPGMTGERLARRILEIRPGMKIILCTGPGDGVTKEAARTMGMGGHLERPFDLQQFARTVRAVLDG